MGSRCLRCVADAIHGYTHPPCYCCHLKEIRAKVCCVCFKDIKTSKQLCRDCVYNPTFELTREKISGYTIK